MKKLLFILTLVAFAIYANAQTKWHKQDKGAYVEITQQGGSTLGYNQNSGVKILTVDGFAFKDLNKNGKLDKYEDWRLSSEVRAKDLASQLSLDEIAGLMLYSAHQQIPGNEKDPNPTKRGHYNGLTFKETRGVAPSALTDEQLKFVGEDYVRHILITKVQNAYTAAEWNNNLQALCESIGHGVPANNSSDPRHRGSKSGDEFDAGGGSQSAWPSALGMAATFDPANIKRFAEIASAEYRALGITTALSPQSDLSTEPRWRRLYMGYGEHSGLVADCVRAYADGFQTSSEEQRIEGAWGRESVNAMAKHWPGGATGEAGRDAHFGIGKYAVYPGNNFEEHLVPFTKGAFALEGGTKQVAAIMPYYTISYNQDPSGENVGNALSKYMIKDLLRGKYGYEGVICTDWRVAEKYVDHRTSNGKPYGMEHLPVEEYFYRALILGVDQFGGVNSTENIKKAYTLGVERLGEKAIRARFELSAVRLLRNFFRVGLFENPYLEPHRSQKIVGNAEFMQAGYDVQVKSIVMLKNHNSTLPISSKTKVYIEKREFAPQRDWWTDKIKGKAKMGYGVSIDMLRKHLNIVDKAEEADCAIVFIDGPTVGRGHSNADLEAGGNGYIPISLQYGDYTAKYARKQSIAGGDIYENFTNRTYKNKSTTTDNKYEMEAVIRAKKLMGNRPVIVVVRVKRPLILSEIEPYADAILLGYEVQNQAYVELVKGNAEPSGLLPMQMPKDMRTVELNKEDVPFDLECYKDADGNVYNFGYGLNWSGVIKDWRTEKYAPRKVK